MAGIFIAEKQVKCEENQSGADRLLLFYLKLRRRKPEKE